ncbi:MAG: hypothetical protein JO356_18405 [Acidobacteria bacterium]|nr:hypothetical protein [Acidobacteriota bacterium]
MKAFLCTTAINTIVYVCLISSLRAQQAPDHGMMMEHEHSTGAALSYEDLTRTAAMLEAARKSTAKYQDVRVAEEEGFRAIGPDVPGMGIHYVRAHHTGFDVLHPDILLYEKDSAAPAGLMLVGVSYLLKAEGDQDGQPHNPPFPRSLATWHRHANLCVLPDRSVKTDLNEEQCAAEGGRFNAQTEWMVHAWIWKDSPDGVFSPTNPTVK